MYIDDLEEELEIEKTKFKTIIKTLPDLLWLKDSDGVYLTCNKRFEDFFGAKEKDIIGKTDYDFVSKELADFFRQHDVNAMNSNGPLINDEEVTFASDGHIEYLNTTKIKILDKKNNIIGVLGIARNISQIKEYQEKIEEEKFKYKNMMKNSTDAIFIVNLDGYIEDCSNEFLRELGYSKEEAYKLHVSDYEAIHSKELINENIKKTEYKALSFESIYRRKDGSLFDVSIRIVRVTLNKEEYIYSSFRDITEQKKLHNKIISQKEEFETIFNYAHDGIAIIDLNSNFLNVNQAFLNITDYTKDELLTKSCLDLTSEKDLALSQEMLAKTIKYSHVDNFEKEYIINNGIRKEVNVSLSLLPDKKKILLTLKDISSLKHIEENSKLASMGEMIGNIAHQWRQPLSMITTSASGLKLKSEFDIVTKEDIQEATDNIQKQALYLSDTIDNFRNYLKGQNNTEKTKLSDIINESLNLVNAALHNNYISVHIDIDKDISINANKNEVSEAFINIINNAKDALKSNIKNEDDRLIFIQTNLLRQNRVELLFFDSAGGINENIIKKVFEPYFTTKHQSHGTGLGLAITKKILEEKQKAEIKVFNKEFIHNSKNYKGACFSIILEISN